MAMSAGVRPTLIGVPEVVATRIGVTDPGSPERMEFTT